MITITVAVDIRVMVTTVDSGEGNTRVKENAHVYRVSRFMRGEFNRWRNSRSVTHPVGIKGPATSTTLQCCWLARYIAWCHYHRKTQPEFTLLVFYLLLIMYLDTDFFTRANIGYRIAKQIGTFLFNQ